MTYTLPSDSIQRKSRKIWQASPSCAPPPSWSSPIGLALRANLSSEVSDRFCQLPLPTLFYWLEAAHLRDLLILSVWLGVTAWNQPAYASLRLSLAIRSVPDATTSCYSLFKEANGVLSNVLESGSSSKNDSKCKVSWKSFADYLVYHCTIIILN